MAKREPVGVGFRFSDSFRAGVGLSSLTGCGYGQIHWRLLAVLGMLNGGI